ncbi:hypothetical protein SK128_016680 [Halocaridina rubra]|uniref:Uncharacterized protein n=1 Tax=Halocaridina rubra TaxID=373956 RepID=A0AAN8X4Q4_HALRR
MNSAIFLGAIGFFIGLALAEDPVIVTEAPSSQEDETTDSLTTIASHEEDLTTESNVTDIATTDLPISPLMETGVFEHDTQLKSTTPALSTMGNSENMSMLPQSNRTKTSQAQIFQQKLDLLALLKQRKKATSTASPFQKVTLESSSKPSQENSDSYLVQQNKEKFLFGSFSTTTYTNVVASTSTVFFSCLSSTTSQNVCQGRGARRKRFAKPNLLLDDYEGIADVQSSKNNEANIAQKNHHSSINGNEGKLAFTVWTTSRSTTSVTVFYTNTSTTIRLAYYCVAGGVQYPTFSCQLLF